MPTCIATNAITADAVGLKGEAPGHRALSWPVCTPNQARHLSRPDRKAPPAKIPLLGVCLGHQAIGQVFGGHVIRAPEPVHGKLATILLKGKGLFKGLPEQFEGRTHYYSLVVEGEDAAGGASR